MKKLNLAVKGMTCTSCEVLIERNLKKVPGVSDVKVSRAKEHAEVTCECEIPLSELQKAIAENGYTLSLKDESGETLPFEKESYFSTHKKRFAEIGAMLLFIGGIYLLLTYFGILPKGYGVTENMSYGFIFLLGLTAGTSTCLAVAGGLLLAVSAKFNEKNQDLTNRLKAVPHLYFNLGRVGAYTLFGGLIGYVGSFLTLSSTVNGILTIVASLFMILVGLQLLKIFPWLERFQLKMPKFIAHKLYDAGSHEQTEATRRNAFLFGAGTFFLPCGFTQALQLYVLGKGDFLTGGLTMLAFSLGTLPALISIGALSSFSKGSFQRHFTTFSAVLVIILGIFNIPSGLVLTGATVVTPATTSSLSIPLTIPLEEGKQIIKMEVKGLDYFPSVFTLRQGVPVEWRVDGRKAQGCAQILSVPALGIIESLPREEIKTISFTPNKAGTIRFSCGMGMAGPGTFTVVQNT
ncbi:sulfite exporter TauE/SafE family protein [Candidatus Woesearchaeota archaeon]|nr:sulfite exporter TauE/SafE family protein [Candidatus Woesearchaeota archaeon]